eukprot:12938837-Ditylum_brightwellii.AAC.1
MTASSAAHCQSEWPTPSITVAVATAVAVGTSSAVTRSVFVGTVWEWQAHCSQKADCKHAICSL